MPFVYAKGGGLVGVHRPQFGILAHVSFLCHQTDSLHSATLGLDPGLQNWVQSYKKKQQRRKTQAFFLFL
jgi:hypothetical protein